MSLAPGPDLLVSGETLLPLVAASTVRTIGAVIAVLATVGVVIYLFVSLRSGREEVGAELELAPNRKPYYDDDTLETRKLTRTLFSGMALLAVSAVGLPLYWLAEPGRQEGAVEGFLNTFEARGLDQYEEGSQCVTCHAADGVGGQATHTILDANGDFVAQVNWMAPALNTVLLRFGREEVYEIIEFGRPGTPMPAWGAGGGGPRSEQEIENIIDYLASIQLSPEEAQRQAEVQLAVELGLLSDEERDDEEAVEAAVAQIDYEDLDTGEALFQLGKDPAFAGGAYACARCHTAGWSIITEGEDAIQGNTMAGIAAYVDYDPGEGSFAPPLNDLVPRQFASVDELAEFVSLGNDEGIGYGRTGQGDGMMPGFGDNPNTEDVADDGMLTREMICALARYESTLHAGESTGEVPTTTTTSTTTTTTPEDDEAAAEGEAEEEEAAQPEPGFCDPEAQESQESQG